VSSLLAQLPALIGVAVGALATILATSFTDRSRWRRSQSVRWDERRLDAYADYAQAIKEIHLLAFRLSATRRGSSRSQPIDRETGMDLLAQADLHRSKMWESVLLLGDAATVEAARLWHEAVRRLVRLASERTNDPSHEGSEDLSDDWRAAVQLVDNTRDLFYIAARQNLLVEGGLVAQTPSLWPQRADAEA